jgi:hypothetical protein
VLAPRSQIAVPEEWAFTKWSVLNGKTTVDLFKNGIQSPLVPDVLTIEARDVTSMPLVDPNSQHAIG